MKPINQTIVEINYGNCFAACVASLFELTLDEVPNFIEKGKDWFPPFWEFIKERGYEYEGVGWPRSEDMPFGHILSESINIDGFVIATVPSKTFQAISHSVLIDLDGNVVHDPNPNKKWQGVNVLQSKELEHWMLLSRASEKIL